MITILELAHGVVRANSLARRDQRQRFLDELLMAVPVEPVTPRIALRAGKVDGHMQARGIRIPLSDLLIGTTALELEYRVGTGNVRHFQQIEGLETVRL